ncbi:hypothetical protein B5C34_05170 [Pacificimonas flava]|uniref:Uncharacterized protein n=2 Tax=Pacificimonas TaxID=1960290 RepID=A0A219B3D9_9SPHN|nr:MULTISPECIES: hypothetical protein [Pacificimonas]MBZ6377391.1 hypothetical protein [Pacificimonas aurantium]OWV32902.1 hypothetical protein B5C34_05170 [Pacificimonas flava]
MADAESPEAVALELVKMIANAEGKMLSGPNANVGKAWVLRTYASAIRTVRQPNLVGDYVEGLPD